jgi:thiol-disulfide isomerase/thioredoxin
MRENNPEKEKNESQKLPIAMLAVAVFGLLLTIVIILSHRYEWIMSLCGGLQSGCADVDSTPFARVALPFLGEGRSIPVAVLGMVAYAFFIFLQVYFPRMIPPLASAMMGAEFYFLWVMKAVLGIFCVFCVIQFVTVAILFLLAMAWGWRRSDHLLPGGAWANLAVLALAFVIPTAPVLLKKSAPMMAQGGGVTFAGNPDAKIRIDIFSDFQCPYCKKIEPVIDSVLQKNPRVQVVFRDYIIPSHQLSPFAVSFANGVALTQGREAFLKIRKEMFENQETLRAFLETRQDMVKFTPELRDKIEKKVAADLKIAESLNISGTPTLVIYRNGQMAQIIQAQDAVYEKIERFIKP